MKLTRKLARSPRRAGFTLIELLVVISIIATLVALVAPAVQSARNAARRMECQSNMKNVALATANFSTAYRGQLPYLYNLHGAVGAQTNYGWVIDLFPYMEGAATYRTIEEWTATAAAPTPFNGANMPPYFKVLSCPLDLNNANQPAGISYVANAGYMRSSDWAANTSHNGNRIAYGIAGVSDMNLARATGVFWTNDGGPRMTVDFISEADGQSTTFMFAENLQAAKWVNTSTVPFSTTASIYTGSLAFGIIAADGSGSPLNTVLNTTSSLATQGLDLVTTPTAGWLGTSGPGGASPSSPSTAAIGSAPRPISNHTGIYNIAYCDGHVEQKNVSMSLKIYASQMTPDGQRNGQPQGDNFE